MDSAMSKTHTHKPCKDDIHLWEMMRVYFIPYSPLSDGTLAIKTNSFSQIEFLEKFISVRCENKQKTQKTIWEANTRPSYTFPHSKMTIGPIKFQQLKEGIKQNSQGGRRTYIKKEFSKQKRLVLALYVL